MKKILFLLSLLVTTAGFAEQFVLENQSAFPNQNQKSKMAIQWASSANEVQQANHTILRGSKLNTATLQPLTQVGKINLTIPQNAEYFRILVWSKNEADFDLLTNWIEVIPNKTYILNTDHLVPVVLMVGMGC